MNIIVSADRNWGIGCQNKLLVRIPQDMKFFRATTTGKVVVMGRKTLESLPNGQPLSNRTNIVLSRDPKYSVRGAIVRHSMEECLQTLREYDTDDVYIIGGESLYRGLLPYCRVAHVTRIDHTFEADTFFPNLDEDPEWVQTADSEEQTYFDLEYEFCRFERVRGLRCV